MHMIDTWWAWRDWLELHPDWILALIFGLATLESLAVIGSIVPAIPFMIGLTLLAGHTGIDVYQVLMFACAGAMCGDGISYAIGHHFKHRIEHVWPFRKNPHWLAASEAFVEKHGGKGLIFGRFIGPIRAFVPLAAGIFQMPLQRFLFYNIVSALLWAPPNILPGYFAGAAVESPLLPGKHQLMFIAAILMSIASLVWLLPRLNSATRAWRQSHAPHNAGLFASAEGAPENQFMTLLVALIGLFSFTVVALNLRSFQPMDLWLTQELTRLRQPSIDWLFTAFSLLADARALLTLGGLVALWLLLRREWRALNFIVIASLLCLTLPMMLQWLFGVPGPIPLFAIRDDASFPSGHAFSVTLLWGLFYVMVTRSFLPELKPWALAISLTLITFTAISRAFLGLHWLSDVLAGLSLGLCVLAILRWAWYRGAGFQRVGRWEPSLVVLAALLLSGCLWLRHSWASALIPYTVLGTGG